MCLAVPVKLETILPGAMGVITIGGVRREVDLSLIDNPAAGDYVLAHAGFAIEKVQADEAEKTLAILREMVGDEQG